jgi:hypothetical protein
MPAPQEEGKIWLSNQVRSSLIIQVASYTKTRFVGGFN